ncbi:FAD-dependent oxidoreductase [Novipirellula maiorica]|nr:FAD-dependent oxidoreductase [Rhodopirellula maiorica]
MLKYLIAIQFVIQIVFVQASLAQQVLVEAESFAEHGGWKLDTQFIDSMGSPYLLAHGLGRPVDDASTKVTFPETGEYRVFVRTKDWVARWEASDAPGKFQIVINDKPLNEIFGTQGRQWHWHDGGSVQIDALESEVTIRDLTGFDGRCDAILFTKDDNPPPNTSDILPQWRRDLLNIDNEPIRHEGYDLVVVGGGYAGMGAAISAARMGCRVALIQNRPVLGGNGSSEVRVWAKGHIRRGKFPRIGEIIEEFCDRATKSPAPYEEFEDAKKERVVRAESNIDLFLNHHAFKVETKDNRITSVGAFDTKTSQHKKFLGQFFVDCTGHGTVGYLAKADWEMTPEGRMGMSNMWTWDESETAKSFPETPWALDLKMEDFPYPRNHHGEWFWESGFDKDAINDAEGIRDWNLRAVYGAFNAMKNRGGAEEHKGAFLTWVAYVGGPRESRRLMGDIILTGDDVVEKRDFVDGCVPSTWSVDLHYPKQQYADKFPDNPFISIAEHDKRVDRAYGYPVPYRCFYSRNISNLFMAGRNISITHKALGTTRVMKTCGMMGEVVGKATSVCVRHDCLPRDVYQSHWSEMEQLLRLPGKTYRESVDAEFVHPGDALPMADGSGQAKGTNPDSLDGIVVDDRDAIKSKVWRSEFALPGFIGTGYVVARDRDASTIRFPVKIPSSDHYEVRIAYQAHLNRGSKVPVKVEYGEKTSSSLVNMKKPPQDDGFHSIGTFAFTKGETIFVQLSSEGAGGNVQADAVQLLPVDTNATRKVFD